MDGGDLFWTVLAAVAMVVGLCGVVIPVLPGLALMWTIALVYGFLVGWSGVGVAAIVVLSALLTVSIVAGVALPRRAAAGAGASGRAQLGGLVGAVVGFFLIPVIGVIIGALAGVLAVELLVKDGWDEAWAATVGTAKGFGVSALVDLGIGLVMLTVWSGWALTVLF